MKHGPWGDVGERMRIDPRKASKRLTVADYVTLIYDERSKRFVPVHDHGKGFFDAMRGKQAKA